MTIAMNGNESSTGTEQSENWRTRILRALDELRNEDGMSASRIRGDARDERDSSSRSTG